MTKSEKYWKAENRLGRGLECCAAGQSFPAKLSLCRRPPCLLLPPAWATKQATGRSREIQLTDSKKYRRQIWELPNCQIREIPRNTRDKIGEIPRNVGWVQTITVIIHCTEEQIKKVLSYKTSTILKSLTFVMNKLKFPKSIYSFNLIVHILVHIRISWKSNKMLFHISVLSWFIFNGLCLSKELFKCSIRTIFDLFAFSFEHIWWKYWLDKNCVYI